MFFFVDSIKRAIIVQACHLKSDVQNIIESKLFRQTEGQVIEKYGWVISVLKIITIGDGVVNDEGDVVFMVEFAAVMFKPIIGEVLDGVVSQCVNHGLKVQVGPFLVFIDHLNMPSNLEYSDDDQIFQSPDKALKIKPNSKIRFKVVNYDSLNGNRLFGSGSIDQDYLGLMDNRK